MRFEESQRMRYLGAHFRLARAATGDTFRSVCEGLGLSPKTLAAVEHAGAIDYGIKRKGRFDEQTIERLVAFYERRGVTFLTSNAQGPGVRFK